MMSRTRRFCFLLATTAVFSIILGGTNNLLAQPAVYEANVPPPNSTVSGNTTGGIRVQNPGLSADMRELGGSLRGWFSYMGAAEERAAEQATTAAAIGAANAQAIGTANDLNTRQGVREGVHADIVTDLSNLADKLCTTASGARSTALIAEFAENSTEQLIQEAMNNINMGAGTDAENGLIDYQRRLFQRATAMCDPSGNGGANVFCAGSGINHITLASLISPMAYRNDPRVPENLNYLGQLLYARIPISINPDLLANPNTEVMNTYIESDRLRAEMSLGQTIFSMLRGNRVKAPNATVENSLRQRMEANGWSSSRIDANLSGGVSRNAMYHALTVGSYGSPFMQQELTGGETDFGLIIAREMMLNNVLQFEQYKLLEAIALMTATTAVMNRDDAIEDLNRRISALNSRQ